MTKRDIAILACKILGVFFFMKVTPMIFTSVSNLMMMVNRHPPSSLLSIAFFGGFMALSTVPLLVLSLLLWFKADWFAKYIFPEEGAPGTVVVNINLVPMALTVTGILVLVWSVPNLISMITISFWKTDQGGTFRTMNLIAAFIQTLLGGWLAFGAIKITHILGTLRSLTEDKEA